MRVADVMRQRAMALGHDLSHIDDDEMGARLVAMPLDVADDVTSAALWMRFACDEQEIARLLEFRGRES